MTHESAAILSAHLSDDALDDLLLDVGSPADAAHLDSCPACSARLATFRSSLAAFNQASTAWSQARSNTISRELTPRRSTFGILSAWSVALAFFVAVALTFLVGIHRGMTPRGSATLEIAQDGAANRQQEIASDNAMLDAIDSEISRPVPSPVDVYGIEKTDAPAPRRTASHEVRD